MREQSWDEALRLAARFQRLGEHAGAIRRAVSAMSSPRLYEELGFDLARIRDEGIAALKARYSKSWQSAQDERGDESDVSSD